MLGYSDSAKDAGPLSATLALYDAQAAHRHLGRPALDQADAVPRPRGRARPGRRPGQPGGAGAGAGLGRWPVQAHRTGRGHLRPLRRPRRSPAGTSNRSRRPPCSRRRRRSRSAPPPPQRSSPPWPGRWTTRRGRPTTPWYAARVRQLVRGGDAGRRAGSAADRVTAGPARPLGVVPRGPARDPVGVRVDSGAGQPDRLVRRRQPDWRPSATSTCCGRRTRNGRCSR